MCFITFVRHSLVALQKGGTHVNSEGFSCNDIWDALTATLNSVGVTLPSTGAK